MDNAGVAVNVHYEHLSFTYFSQIVEKSCYWKICLFSPKQAVLPTN